MRNKNRARVAITAGLALCLIAVGASAKTVATKTVKQNALGADSLGTAADTTTAETFYAKGTQFFATVASADTAFTWIVQVSPDGTNWFNATTLDTCEAGTVETTADLGDQYAGWQVRLILDNLGAANNAFGRGWVVWSDN